MIDNLIDNEVFNEIVRNHKQVICEVYFSKSTELKYRKKWFEKIGFSHYVKNPLRRHCYAYDIYDNELDTFHYHITLVDRTPLTIMIYCDYLPEVVDSFVTELKTHNFKVEERLIEKYFKKQFKGKTKEKVIEE